MSHESFAPPAEWRSDNAAWLSAAQAQWAPTSSEPCRIRLWLGAPVAWDGYTAVCLEGALQWAVIMLMTGMAPDHVYSGIGRGWCPPPIPIDHLELTDVDGVPRTIARCSVAQPAPVAHETMRFRRKRARVEPLGIPGTIVTAGGWAKSLNIPVPTLTTPWLDFYAVADISRLRELLPHAPGLGRDTKRALGVPVGWEVSPMTEDRSLAYDARPMRVLPIMPAGHPFSPERFAAGTFDVREHGTHAPYWHQASRARCVVPRLQGAA